MITPETIATDTFITEFERVFGSIEVSDGGGLMYYNAKGWPYGVLYDMTRAIPVLAGFPSMYGATKQGDADVREALHRSGSVVGLIG